MNPVAPSFPDAAEVLLRRRAELRKALQDAAGAALDASQAPQQVSDFKDLAAEEAQAAVDDMAAQQVRRELADIEAALGRIREGSYGICEMCGEAIAPARLLAVPAGTLCATCQAQRERAGAQRA